MKKIMIFAAFAAALSLASCQKEGLNEVVKNDPSAVSESPVFTGTINAGTKTTVDAASGKVSWETTDEITVTDKDQKTAVYSIESIDGTTGRATFVYKSGDTLGEGSYTATYGTAPTTAQTYSATPGKLYMTAPETSTNSFNFTIQCGLMEINLTKAGESVKSIAVTGTPTGGSETTYTMTCTDAQSIAEKTAFYISVAAGSYNKIVITDSEDKVCTLTAASGITVAANHIKPLTFADSKLDFKPSLPAGALPGVFTVSNDDGTTKTQIYFSQGNLWYGKVGDAQTATFNFEANQYGFKNSWDATYVSHFYWSKDASVAYANSYNESGTTRSDVFFTNATETTAKEGFNVNVNGKNQPGWRTLSTKEWQYLFNIRTMKNGDARYENLTSSGITVEGVTFKGVVLFPDDFTDQADWKTKYTTWKALNDAGLVFLPAAGYRSGSSVFDVGDYGYYLSSADYDKNRAYSVRFNSSSVDPGKYVTRSSGYGVRLVTEGGSPAPSVVPVESVSLDKTTATIVKDGTVTLSATVLPDNATDKSVSWSSNNTGVATVDASGKVTAVAAGTATITVTTTNGGKTATCTVTVKTLPAGALSGEFSVSATKKVYFSKGNLYYNGSKFDFEANQYEYHGYDSANNTWGLFGWSTEGNNFGMSTSESSEDYSGNFLDWGTTIDNKGTWKTLSGGADGEWKYLFDHHVNVWGTCNSVLGRFIAPDGFVGDASALSEAINDWESAQAAGIVFLPAAGYRTGSGVYNFGGNGRYWSSTACDSEIAYGVYTGSNVSLVNYDDRYSGYSVRLVTECQ